MSTRLLVAEQRTTVWDAFTTQSWAVPAIVLLGFALRLVLVLWFPQAPASDAAFYVHAGQHIAAGDGYQEAGHPTAFWPVGYPALLGASFWLLGPSTLGPILINLLAVGGSFGLILWFGRRVVGSELAARFALLLYAVYPAHIVYTGLALTEPVYTTVILAAFAMIIARRKTLPWFCLAGMLFGLATLIKVQTLLFPASALFTLTLVYRDYRWPSVIKAAFLLHLGLFAVVAPWTLRNYHVFNEPVLVSTNGGYALYTGANPLADGSYMALEASPLWQGVGVPFAERIERQVELDHRLHALAMDWIQENPVRFASLIAPKVFYLWYKDTDGFWNLKRSYPGAETGLTLLQALNQVFYCAILLLSIPCLIATLRALAGYNSNGRSLALLWCTPVFVTLISTVFTGQTRYHFSAMPALVLAASWTMARMAGRHLPSS